MEKEIKAEDIYKELGEIKTKLELQVDEKLRPIKNDLDVTIKAFDKWQITNKGARPGSIEKIDLKSQLASSIQDGFPQLENFIKKTDESLKEIKFQVKSTTLSANYSGGTMGITQAPSGIVGGLSTTSRIRDLLRVIPMTTGILPVIKNNGETGGFAMTAEGATKPNIDFSLAEVGARAETLAVTSVISRQFLEDLTPLGVMQWLQSTMLDLYLDAEDAQLLDGTGVSPQVPGMNHAGNFTSSTSSATNGLIRLIQALIQMKGLRMNPSAIIISADDLGVILLNVSTGSGEFNLPSFIQISNTGGISILGVPVIISASQTANRFDILDANQMVYGNRESFNLRLFEQDASNVTKNLITIRAESRFAFSVYSPSAVIQGFFTEGS